MAAAGPEGPDLQRSLPDSWRGGVLLKRSVSWPERNVVALTHTLSGNGTRTIVTHSASLIAQVEVQSGEITFPLASGTVRAPRRFILVVPPRSVLPIRFEEATLTSAGLGTMAGLERRPRPALLEWSAGSPLEWSALSRAALLATLDADAGVAPAIVAARRGLHANLAAAAPIRLAALRQGIRPDSLSREFTRAYGCAPKAYCTRARMFDAVIALLTGARILDAALRAGFGDIKRFYDHFRLLLKTTPGTYASIKNRQDSPRARG